MATFIPVHIIPLQIQDPVTSVNMSSGTLEFFLAGTTTTTELFADNAGTSIGTSITLNSAGMPESGGTTITLFRDQAKALKIVGKNAAGAVIFTSDGIPAVASFDGTASAKLDGVEALADVTDATNIAAAGGLLADGTVAVTGSLTATGTGEFIRATTSGITASTTQTQGNGVLATTVNEVSVVANANDTVTMPTAKAGREIFIFHNGANTLQIFPASGDNIDSGAVDASTTVSAGSNAHFIAYSDTSWEVS